MSARERDEELMELALRSGLHEWLLGDLFPSSAVPFWALNALARLEAAGRVVRRQTARAMWKYAVVPPKSSPAET